jgi:uncharacterized lipoprotein YajG
VAHKGVYVDRPCRAVAATLIFGACTYNPQQVEFDPVVKLVSGSVGQGVWVAARGVDERPSKTIGKRADGYGLGTEISFSDDLASIVKGKVVAGLAAQGFAATETASESASSLLVESRFLEYNTAQRCPRARA